MNRHIVIALALLAAVLVGFTYATPGDNGFAEGESVAHGHMNQIDSALDALETATDFLAADSLNFLDAGSINSLSKINAILISETIADGAHTTEEEVEDFVGGLLLEGTGVDVTYIDGSNTLTITGDKARNSQAMATSEISANSCATVITVSASGVATTDIVNIGFNGDPTAVTGYGPGASDGLAIYAYPTSNNVNFKVCNMTGSAITPGALTINWSVSQ